MDLLSHSNDLDASFDAAARAKLKGEKLRGVVIALLKEYGRSRVPS